MYYSRNAYFDEKEVAKNARNRQTRRGVLQKIRLLYCEYLLIRRKPICLKTYFPIGQLLSTRSIYQRKLSSGKSQRKPSLRSMHVQACRVIPLSKMAVLLMRKHLYNFSDERVVAYWETNPYFYFQYQDRQQVPGILGDTYYVRDRGSIHLSKLQPFTPVWLLQET